MRTGVPDRVDGPQPESGANSPTQIDSKTEIDTFCLRIAHIVFLLCGRGNPMWLP